MRKLLLFIVVVSGLFISLTLQADLNLELPKQNVPVVSSGQARFFSSLKERNKGLKIVRKLRASGQIIDDPEINTWIRSLGNRLTSGAAQSSSPFYFLVSKKQSINAFATQGGVVVVNAGLILRSSSESEVAAVIAHEIAHITQRHISRMRAKAKTNTIGTTAALVVGAVASTQDSQVGQAIINTTLATSIHQQLSFSREAESEADRIGLTVLARAGFNPLAMPSVLQKLEQFRDNNSDDVKEFLQNHPLAHKRVTDVSTRAKRLIAINARRPRAKSNNRYYFMREKIRVLVKSSLGVPNRIHVSIKKYAQVQKLKQRKNYALALKGLNQKTRQLSEALLKAKLYNRVAKFDMAIDVLSPLILLYPGNEALSISLSRSYIALNQADKAWRLLNEVSIQEQTSLEFFELKQKVAQRMGYTALAYQAVAEKNIRTANYGVAKIQLKRAIKYLNTTKGFKNNNYQISQLKNHIERLPQ